MGVSKVIIDDEVKLDLTADTVEPAALKAGYTAHNAAGNKIVGTMSASGGTFKVTVTFYPDTYMCTSDKTLQEALAAYNAGMLPYVEFHSYDAVEFYEMQAKSDAEIIFVHYFMSFNASNDGIVMPSMGCYSITLTDDGAILDDSGSSDVVSYVAVNPNLNAPSEDTVPSTQCVSNALSKKLNKQLVAGEDYFDSEAALPAPGTVGRIYFVKAEA